MQNLNNIHYCLGQVLAKQKNQKNSKPMKSLNNLFEDNFWHFYTFIHIACKNKFLANFKRIGRPVYYRNMTTIRLKLLLINFSNLYQRLMKSFLVYCIMKLQRSFKFRIAATSISAGAESKRVLH